MKLLLTLGVLLVSTLSLAQFTPYNPDADNDQFVGAQDLLAFLPLFGEDWDLDSLNVYASSELETPNWCEDALPNPCVEYVIEVPQDADVVHYDGGVQYLVLPEIPRPLVIFGCEGNLFSGPNSVFASGVLFDEDLKLIGSCGQAGVFTILLPFYGQWYALN
jgi:hypothetical protein